MGKVMLAGKQVTFRTKISNSKKQLARIINENGGWPAAAGFAVQDKKRGTVPFAVVFYTKQPQRPRKGSSAHVANPDGVAITAFSAGVLLPNWHQTVLARDEYFHLYPAPDADGWIEWKGGECPVEDDAIIDIRFRDGREESGVDSDWSWVHSGEGDIVAYRLRKPEQSKSTAVGDDETNMAAKEELDVIEFEPMPTIEQLAAEHRNRQDYAERKQQEADAAKAEAEVKLAELVAAGKAVGLEISIAKEVNNA